jgi:hypothetical protein
LLVLQPADQTSVQAQAPRWLLLSAELHGSILIIRMVAEKRTGSWPETQR